MHCFDFIVLLLYICFSLLSLFDDCLLFSSLCFFTSPSVPLSPVQSSRILVIRIVHHRYRHPSGVGEKSRCSNPLSTIPTLTRAPPNLDTGSLSSPAPDTSTALARRHDPLSQIVHVGLTILLSLPLTKVIRVLDPASQQHHLRVAGFPSLDFGNGSSIGGRVTGLGAENMVAEVVRIDGTDDVAAQREFHGALDGDVRQGGSAFFEDVD